MAGPVEVLRAEDLPPNSVTARQVRDRRLAAVHRESGFFALDDECTHQGAPLSEGDPAGLRALRRPWHRDRFDVRAGEVLD
ncbi:MAG: Rieske (2Fe-2S) protein [Acidimicrobiales bacterium]